MLNDTNHYLSPINMWICFTELNWNFPVLIRVLRVGT